MKHTIQPYIEKAKKYRWYIGIALLIFFIGGFLRMYHFNEWIWFWNDQVRDVRLIQSVVDEGVSWPLLGPSMLFTEYHLGPIYYYFQILSGMIFGVEPYTVAYPDLFFSLLSLPLFFFFARRYFDTRMALLLTLLMACSFFFVRYGRFAWNINPLPFFSILFLLSLHTYLVQKKATPWGWVALLGIGIGVSVQLHAIALLLVSLVSTLAFLYTIKKDWRIYTKWIGVLGIVALLNAGSILYDLKNDFNNSRAFIQALTEKKEGTQETGLMDSFGRDVDCHAEVSYHILTSWGNRDYCDFYFTSLFSDIGKNIQKGKFLFHKIDTGEIDEMIDAYSGMAILIIFLFAFLWVWRREGVQSKKIFLGIIFFYTLFSFIVLYPVGDMLKGRYYLHIAPLVYIFLGFFFQYFLEKYGKKGWYIVVAIASILVMLNMTTLIQEGNIHLKKSASEEKNPIYGELQDMVDFIQKDADSSKKIYLSGTKMNRFTFGNTMRYIAQRQGLDLHIIESLKEDSYTEPLYYISKKGEDAEKVREKKDRAVLEYSVFGKMILYRLSGDVLK